MPDEQGKGNGSGLRQMAEAFARLRAKERGQPPDEPLTFNVREHIVLQKFDHTPAPGEDVAPLETVTIHAGTHTVTVTGEE